MNDLDRIEIDINEAKEVIGVLEALKRLENNDDFKKVITEGYFVQEASRLVLIKADPNLAEDGSQKTINNSIIAVGQFRQYLSSVYQLGGIAQRSIIAGEEAREEILSEEE